MRKTDVATRLLIKVLTECYIILLLLNLLFLFMWVHWFNKYQARVEPFELFSYTSFGQIDTG